MIIDCISDLHGHYPKLEGGDLLIVAGDLTKHDTQLQHKEFFEWMDGQNYYAKAYIAGNHDNYYQKNEAKKYIYPAGVVYLEDQAAEFEGLKIWGSPWTQSFEGMNPHCKAFTLDTEKELAKKWALIPDDIDILITHSPPYGSRDMIVVNDKLKCIGSKSLQKRSLNLDLKLWVVGHIHEGYGVDPFGGILGGNNCKLVNASHVNERYEPVNKPIRIIL